MKGGVVQSFTDIRSCISTLRNISIKHENSVICSSLCFSNDFLFSMKHMAVYLPDSFQLMKILQ